MNALQYSLPAGSVLDIVADVSELEVWVLEHAGLVVILEGVTAVNFVQAEVPPSPHTVVSHPLVLLLVHVLESGVESSLRGVGEAVVEDGCVVTVAKALTLHSQKIKVSYANHMLLSLFSGYLSSLHGYSAFEYALCVSGKRTVFLQIEYRKVNG